jgi:hypothetical protein
MLSPALQNATNVLETAEFQAFQMYCTPSVIWSLFYAFIFCRKSSFLSGGKSFPFLLPFILLQLQNNTEFPYAEKQEFHSLWYFPCQSQ